jgi:HEAT repeat protein
LGRIGGAPGAKALEPLLAGAPPAVRPAVAEGCILCAEKFLAEGNHAGAAKLYDAVRNANVSKSKTVEATRGAILARRAEGVALLVEQLKSGDKAFFNIGLRTARELPGREVTQALLAEMERATPERQSYFLLVLADRGDAEALGAAIKLAQNGPQPQRLTAIGVLDRLNDPSAVPVLLSLAADRDEKLSQAAKTTLTRLPGAGVDAAVLALLKQGDETARRVGCELATQRHLTGAIPDLLKAAEDSNPAISVASLKALGELGGAAEMPALLDILARAKNTAPVENALSALGARLPRPATGNVLIQKAVYGDLPDGPSADVTAKVAELVKGSTSVKASNANLGDTAGGRVKKLRVDYTVDGAPGSQTVAENETMTFPVSTVSPMFVDALGAALAKAPARAKSALLRVLAAAGGAKALAAVRAAMSDPDGGLREAAFHALCQWSTPEALGDLKELAKNGADQKQQILATRGYIQLIGRADLPAQRKLESLQEAMTFIQRDDERKLALGALGGIKSPQAIKLIVPHLDNPALKEEACAAAMSVAENFRRGVPPVVAEAMTKVAQTTSNPELARQAKAVAARVEKRAKKK